MIKFLTFHIYQMENLLSELTTGSTGNLGVYVKDNNNE